MSSSSVLRCLALTSSLVACAADKPDGAPAFVDFTGGADSPGASGAPSAAGAPTLGSPLAGLPTDDGIRVEPSVGCTKVDFVFVVDNSLSMLEEQTALVNSFPGFMRVLEQTLGASDFHVMVVDTDASDVRDTIGALLGQPGADSCSPVLGAGRRQSQAGQDCGLTSGQRYIDASQADLTATFSCAAQVGTLGNPREAPVDAMLAALAPSINAPSGCNAGFLRDDAILVVTLIGDEDDAVSSGDPPAWRQSLIQVKGGSDESIVFLGLVGGEPGSSVSSSCSDADPAPRLRSLIQGFQFGSTGDICAADYAPFFAQAVSVIDTACADFEPVIR